MQLPNEEVTQAARLGAQAYLRNTTNSNALPTGCTPNTDPEKVFVIAACKQARWNSAACTLLAAMLPLQCCSCTGSLGP